MIVAMVVLGGMGHLPGRDPGRGAAVGAARGAALRGRPAAGHDRRPPDSAILRQLLIALAMIGIMLLRRAACGRRPSRQAPDQAARTTAAERDRPKAAEMRQDPSTRAAGIHEGRGILQALRRPAGPVRTWASPSSAARSTA